MTRIRGGITCRVSNILALASIAVGLVQYARKSEEAVLDFI